MISKGRFENCPTPKFLAADGVPFKLVVEPQEVEEYATRYGRENVLVLPFSNLGLGGIPARNWVWEHAKAAGYHRHWILDDNMSEVRRRYKGKRLPCDSGPAFACIEDFVDRYENVAIAGMAYQMFVNDKLRVPPFMLNVHVYSCLLIRNDLSYRWRGRYNEDTDLCLQALSSGECTVLVNAFMVNKMATMTMKGGNSAELYKGDGRLRMARSLERVWPHVVSTDRRFERPQHVVRGAWRNFGTQLIRKPGLVIPNGPNEYGLRVEAVKPVRSPALQKLLAESQAEAPSEPEDLD